MQPLVDVCAMARFTSGEGVCRQSMYTRLWVFYGAAYPYRAGLQASWPTISGLAVEPCCANKVHTNRLTDSVHVNVVRQCGAIGSHMCKQCHASLSMASRSLILIPSTLKISYFFIWFSNGVFFKL